MLPNPWRRCATLSILLGTLASPGAQAGTLPAPAPASAPARAAAPVTPPAPAVTPPPPLLQARCLGCHQPERKVVGPAFRDVAARYAAQPGAVDYLATRIREGGSGAWGTAVMPANRLGEAEARSLAAWVLGMKTAR